MSKSLVLFVLLMVSSGAFCMVASDDVDEHGGGHKVAIKAGQQGLDYFSELPAEMKGAILDQCFGPQVDCGTYQGEEGYSLRNLRYVLDTQEKWTTYSSLRLLNKDWKGFIDGVKFLDTRPIPFARLKSLNELGLLPEDNSDETMFIKPNGVLVDGPQEFQAYRAMFQKNPNDSILKNLVLTGTYENLEISHLRALETLTFGEGFKATGKTVLGSMNSLRELTLGNGFHDLEIVCLDNLRHLTLTGTYNNLKILGLHALDTLTLGERFKATGSVTLPQGFSLPASR